MTHAKSQLWSEEENEAIRTAYARAVPVKKIAADLGRTNRGVRSQAGKLRLRHPNARRPEGSSETAMLGLRSYSAKVLKPWPEKARFDGKGMQVHDSLDRFGLQASRPATEILSQSSSADVAALGQTGWV